MNAAGELSGLFVFLWFALTVAITLAASRVGAAEGDLLGPARTAPDEEPPAAVDSARAYPRTALTTLWILLDTLMLAAATAGFTLGGLDWEGWLLAFGLATLVLVARGLARRRHLAQTTPPRGRWWPLIGLLMPPTRLLRGLVRRLRGGGDAIADRFVAGDQAEGTPTPETELDPHERALLARVRAFGSRRVRDVMTPRIDVFSLAADLPIEQILQAVEDVRFARVPIHRHQKDDVAGVLYIKELIGRSFDADFEIESILHPPEIVSADAPLDEVLRDMRRRRAHLALVFDEMGSLLGLVTLEDLLEELFGEIRDEGDDEDTEIEHHGAALVVPGRMSISTLGRELARSITAADPDGTLGGLLMSQAGHIPRLGEEILFDGLRFTIERREGSVLRRIRVEENA